MSIFLMYPGLPSVEIDWDIIPRAGEYVRSSAADKTLWHTVTDICYDVTDAGVEMLIHLSEAHERKCPEGPVPGFELKA